MKVAAIVPAFNEEENIGNVLKILLKSPQLDEIIVVDDGSTDKTSDVAEKLDVKVIKIIPNKGKGNAMKVGVKSTDSEIVVFFDADLIGLTLEHISKLVEPVKNRKVEMCAAIRERHGFKKIVGAFFIKLDPLLVVAGERAMKKSIFDNIPERFIQKYMVETALNYYCKVNKLPVKYVRLEGLDIIIKRKKWGFIKGNLRQLKMILQIFKIRILMVLNKKDFQKNV